MHHIPRYLFLALALVSTTAAAQGSGDARRGAKLYAEHCQTCHGRNLTGGEWAIDLRTFPKDERARFVDSVTHGKNAMPPWGDLLKPDDVAALWAYVVSGGEVK